MTEEKPIRLTPQELEEIKDEVRFREKTTLTLKYLSGKVQDVGLIREDVKSLKTHRVIHWTLILAIFLGVFLYRALIR